MSDTPTPQRGESVSGLRIEYRLILEGGEVCRDTEHSLRSGADAVKLAEHWAKLGRSASTGQTGRVEMRAVGNWEPIVGDDGKLRPAVETRPSSWSCPCCGEDMGAPECDACWHAASA
jgi:hypothetical protein